MTVIVVLGATGIVGNGVVKVFLKKNATVIAPVRGDPKKLTDELGALGSSKNLHTPTFAYGEKEGATNFAKWIQETIRHPIDHVFAVGGGMAPYTPVSGITDESWKSINDNKILPMVYAAQTLIPLLRDEESSSFTFVTGLLGEVCYAPPLALTTIANAAVYGLVLATQSEQKGRRYRINELRIAALITYDHLTENPGFPGSPATKTSVLAKFYNDNVAANHSVRDTVVRVNGSDVGL